LSGCTRIACRYSSTARRRLPRATSASASTKIGSTASGSSDRAVRASEIARAGG